MIRPETPGDPVKSGHFRGSVAHCDGASDGDNAQGIVTHGRYHEVATAAHCNIGHVSSLTLGGFVMDQVSRRNLTTNGDLPPGNLGGLVGHELRLINPCKI